MAEPAGGGRAAVRQRPGLHRLARLAGRVGYRRHRLLLEGSYTRWRVIEVGRDNAGAEPAHLSTNALGWRAGYGVLVYEGAREVEVGALGAFHWMWTIGGTTPFTTPEAALRVTVLDPWGPREPRGPGASTGRSD